MRIRTFIRERRTEHGWTQPRLAQLAGIPEGNLSRMEQGKELPSDEQYLTLWGLLGGPLYPPSVARVLLPDLEPCPGCDSKPSPAWKANQFYHGKPCRDRARRRVAA